MHIPAPQRWDIAAQRNPLFRALPLATAVFHEAPLSFSQRIVVFLFVKSKLGLHSGFLVKDFANRGRLISTVFLIGERLEGPVEGKRKSDGDGCGFLVSHAADRVIANMTGQEDSILTGVLYNHTH